MSENTRNSKGHTVFAVLLGLPILLSFANGLYRLYFMNFTYDKKPPLIFSRDFSAAYLRDPVGMLLFGLLVLSCVALAVFLFWAGRQRLRRSAKRSQ